MSEKHKVSVFVCSLLLIFASCDVQNTDMDKQTDNRLTLSNDTQELSKRIQSVNQPLVFNNKRAKSNTSNFMHLANAPTPTIDGRPLSATAIHISGDYAYVSYHLHGEDYGGALEVFDISDANNPQIVSSLKFSDTDLNDVTINASATSAWVAGGRNVDTSPYDYEENGHQGAIVAEIEIQNNELTSRVNEAPLKSFSGNAVEEYDNYLGVTTGSTGGIYVINKSDFSIVESLDKDLAKHFDVEGNEGVGMALNANSSNHAILYRYDADTDQMDELNTQTIVNPTNGKNVVDLHDDLVYAAMGDKGFKAFDFSNPSAPVATFSLQGDGLASGLDAGDDFLYMAAGSEGLYIADISNLNEVYNWDNNEQGSANYVESDGEYIFLAKGMDGLNILHKSNPEPTACPFDSNDGTVVDLQGNRLYSNSNEVESQTDLASINLSSGTYTVKLFAYDDHRNDRFDRSQQNQTDESFYVSLRQGGSEIAQTDPLGDIPDENDLGKKTTTLNNVQINSGVDEVQGIHAAYPDDSSPNSFTAKCVAFKKN